MGGGEGRGRSLNFFLYAGFQKSSGLRPLLPLLRVCPSWWDNGTQRNWCVDIGPMGTVAWIIIHKILVVKVSFIFHEFRNWSRLIEMTAVSPCVGCVLCRIPNGCKNMWACATIPKQLSRYWYYVCFGEKECILCTKTCILNTAFRSLTIIYFMWLTSDLGFCFLNTMDNLQHGPDVEHIY